MLDENPEELISLTLGNKLYEMSNHLGNVLTVINDIKVPQSSNSVDIDGYLATIVSTADYSPFGVQLDERTESAESYRYGFNGMERENDWSGEGNMYTTEFRMLDPRLGRWLTLDPLMAKFPHTSPYAAFANNPVYFVDPYGLEPGKGDDDCSDNNSNEPVTNQMQQNYSNFMTEVARLESFMNCNSFFGESEVGEITFEQNFDENSNVLSFKGTIQFVNCSGQEIGTFEVHGTLSTSENTLYDQGFNDALGLLSFSTFAADGVVNISAATTTFKYSDGVKSAAELTGEYANYCGKLSRIATKVNVVTTVATTVWSFHKAYSDYQDPTKEVDYWDIGDGVAGVASVGGTAMVAFGSANFWNPIGWGVGAVCAGYFIYRLF